MGELLLREASLEELRRTTDPFQCLALGRVLTALARQVDDAAGLLEWVGALRQPWAETLTKEPWLLYDGNVSATLQAQLFPVLVDRFGLRAGSGLWDLVTVVERDYPQADLTRPWPEPVVIVTPLTPAA